MTSQAALLTLERDRSESASESIIRALSDVTGIDPMRLPPLYESIEPDALDQLFATSPQERQFEERTLRFTYEDHVVVCRDSEVSVFAACSACTA